MDVVPSSYIPAADPRLIDQIVYELKSQGIFDQFRKECIADVDTKPAYQNLRQRVEGNVMKFLRQQKWSEDTNKNQLREQLRKNISESGYLETGVERIVDQVVNPKINSVFLPKVEDVVYRFLGLQKPNRESKKENKVTVMDLLPNDLEAVSPESEHDLSSEQKDEVAEISEKSNHSDIKMEEDVSPAFEPLNSPTAYSPRDENSVDSHLSGISASHESISSDVGRSSNQVELSQDTSQNSTESQPSLTSDETSKMEVYESYVNESIKMVIINKDSCDSKDNKNSDSCESEVLVDIKSTKTDEKLKFDTKSKSYKERKDEIEKKSSGKYRDYQSDYKTSSKHSSKDKDKNASKPKKTKEDLKDRKDKDRSKDKEKTKDKSHNYREGKDKESKEKSERDKNRSSTSSRHKETSSSSKKDGESQGKTSSSNKEKKLSVKELEIGEKDSLSKNKDSNLKNSELSGSDKDKNGKNKNSSSRDKDLSFKEKINKNKEKISSKEKDNKSKELIKKDKDSVSKTKDILNIDQNKIDKNKSNKDKISSRDKVKDTDTRSTEKNRSGSDSKDKSKDSKSSDGKIKHHEKTKKIVKEKSSSSTNQKNSSSSKKDKEKKPKDDHYSSKEKKNDRRSTDRDSNDGSGKMSRNSSFTESNNTSYKVDNKNSSVIRSSGSGDSSNSDQVEEEASSSKNVYNKVEPVKYFKPKFASNIREAMHLMKIRKRLAELERTNQLALLTINQSSVPNDKLDENSREQDEMEFDQDIKDCNSEVGKGNEPLLQSTELTKERWEELEARLELEMSNVNSSVYEAEGEEDNEEYDTLVVSPKKMRRESDLPALKDAVRSVYVASEEVNKKDIVINVKKISVDDTLIEDNFSEQENDTISKVLLGDPDGIKDFQKNVSSKSDGNSKVLFVKIDKIGSTPNMSDTEPEDHHNGQLLLKKSSESRKWEDDDSPCFYFTPSIASKKHLQKLNGVIMKLEKSIQEESLKIQNNIPRIRKGDRKRKRENVTNNNKLNNLHNLDTKRRRLNSAEVKKHKLNERHNDGPQDHKFCLPLSPDDSDVDNKKEEPVTVKTKKGYRRTFDSKRYSNEDLYKPRPILTRTRRGQVARNDSL